MTLGPGAARPAARGARVLSPRVRVVRGVLRAPRYARRAGQCPARTAGQWRWPWCDPTFPDSARVPTMPGLTCDGSARLVAGTTVGTAAKYWKSRHAEKKNDRLAEPITVQRAGGQGGASRAARRAAIGPVPRAHRGAVALWPLRPAVVWSHGLRWPSVGTRAPTVPSLPCNSSAPMRAGAIVGTAAEIPKRRPVKKKMTTAQPNLPSGGSAHMRAGLACTN